MADEELEAIRARRMAELQAQYGVRQCMGLCSVHNRYFSHLG